MSRTRVLVVDDAVVIRRLVTQALDSDPTIEVVGTAPNGRVALAKIEQVNPDVVTLDVEMPEMDGLETLTVLRKRYPRLPVIMFSTLTERGTATTMDALLRGANDYVTKPANVGSVAEAQARVRASLIPKVHALAGARRAADRPRPSGPLAGRASASPAGVPRTLERRPAAPASPARRRVSGPSPRVELVVIGVSTGGPNALAALVPALPADLPVPVCIVQHMPPMFTKLLADRLDAASPLRVREAVAGEPLRAGQVLIAPGDHHLVVATHGGRRVAELRDTPPENSCRPAADVLFRTAAQSVGGGVLGVVLTGMGHDGRHGAEAIAEAGGRVVVQDEATSVVWGMPGAVVQAGVADEVAPLEQIAGIIGRRVAARGLPPRSVPRGVEVGR